MTKRGDIARLQERLGGHRGMRHPSALGRKFASSSGASIVLAVVIFAIASIFCVTTVNAALSSAGNVRDQIADEQDFLATSSAAKLLQDIVPGKSVSVEGLGEESVAQPKCTVPDSVGNAQAVLQAMGDSLLPAATEEGRRKTVTFSAGDNVPPVTVTMIPSTKKGSYDIVALVKGEKGNALAVSFKGVAVAGEGNAQSISWQVDRVGKNTEQRAA